MQGKVSAVDVLQDAYLVAWRRIGELEARGGDALGQWLGKVVDFKVKEVVRHYVEVGKRGSGGSGCRRDRGRGCLELGAGPDAEPGGGGGRASGGGGAGVGGAAGELSGGDASW